MPPSVARGAAALLLARLVPPAASFGVFYLALRHWAPETWGLFHLLLSTQAVLQMAAGLGVDLLVLQKGAAKPGELPQLLRAVSALLLRVGFALGAAMVVSALLLTDKPQSVLAAAFFAASVPAASLAPTLEASWVSLGRAPHLAPIVLLEHGTRLLASYAALGMGGGPALLALVFFATKWLGAALLYLPLRVGPRTAAPLSLRDVVRQASPYALFFAATAFLGRMDTLALALFQPLTEVGFYGAAARVMLFCTIPAQALGLAIYPRLTAARASAERYRDMVRMTLFTLGAASFVPAGWLHAFPEKTLQLLRLDSYLSAAPLLGILAFALPALFSNEALFRCLLAEERMKDALRVAGLQVVAGIPAFAAAAHLHGAKGAAVATVLVSWLGTFGYLLSRRGGSEVRTEKRDNLSET